MSAIGTEFERLAVIFERLGRPQRVQLAASLTKLDSITTRLGIDVCHELRDLWRISDGSGGQFWFAVGQDEFTPFCFLSVDDAVEEWLAHAPYDEANFHSWYDDESWGKRDPRIQRYLLRHKKWFPFATSPVGNGVLYVDLDPTEAGINGQIIEYIHDPNGVF